MTFLNCMTWVTLLRIHYFYHLPHNKLQSACFVLDITYPIIKNKTGDTSDKNNYRPIALVTAARKIFEICLSIILEDYLVTHDQQFD